MRYLACRSSDHIGFVHVALLVWRTKQILRYSSLSFRRRSVIQTVSSTNCILIADISHVDGSLFSNSEKVEMKEKGYINVAALMLSQACVDKYGREMRPSKTWFREGECWRRGCHASGNPYLVLLSES